MAANAFSANDAASYKSKDVKFKNDTIVFGGTLSFPNNVENAPAVILLSGTGKQDRDGSMANHKMFVDIADYLSSHGIAVLRFDDRGTGESTGVYETSTTMDFADDGLAALEFLKTQKELTVIA